MTKPMTLSEKTKIMGEFYKYSARNPKSTARGFVGKVTENDNEKFRKWMQEIARRYNVSYSEVRSFFGK